MEGLDVPEAFSLMLLVLGVEVILVTVSIQPNLLF
jgi:hypothetical protein